MKKLGKIGGRGSAARWRQSSIVFFLLTLYIIILSLESRLSRCWASWASWGVEAVEAFCWALERLLWKIFWYCWICSVFFRNSLSRTALIPSADFRTVRSVPNVDRHFTYVVNNASHIRYAFLQCRHCKHLVPFVDLRSGTTGLRRHKEFCPDWPHWLDGTFKIIKLSDWVAMAYACVRMSNYSGLI